MTEINPIKKFKRKIIKFDLNNSNSNQNELVTRKIKKIMETRIQMNHHWG